MRVVRLSSIPAENRICETRSVLRNRERRFRISCGGGCANRPVVSTGLWHKGLYKWILLVAFSLSHAAEPDARQGEAAAAAARPLAGIFGGSEPDAFRKAVSAISDLQVFEGLPDPKAESALFAKEAARDDVMQVGDFWFYTHPLPMGEAGIAELRSIFNPGNPFSPNGGGDACGRFHPDYVLVWKSGKSVFFAQIGLGCEEIEAVGPSIRIHRYIPPAIYARLDRVLGKHTVNRPPASR